MAGTTNFGPVTVNPGPRTFGPVNLANTDTMLDLTIDRTVANGFNATPAASAEIAFEQSNDGGATWTEICNATFTGGIQTGHGGTQLNTNDVGSSLFPGTGRQGRAIVTISGAAVAVAGSLVIS
jgi:hypothetical protein